MEGEQPQHKRRSRYKGTHPKSFQEKYKELQPDQYAGDVEKIISKGKTPAGMHISVCMNEIMEALQLRPGLTGLDATLGYGGHSAEILKRILPGGKLFATDIDPYELPKTSERLNKLGFGADVFFPRQMNFAHVDLIAAEAGPLDFVLADLGLSSMQIDNPSRGFTLKTDAPLDLRLDPTHGKPASSLLKNITLERLEALLSEYSDEPYAAVVAHEIIDNRSKGNPILTTTNLKDIITAAVLKAQPKMEKEDLKKTLQRCFQALRIEVNHEFRVLEEFLNKLPEVLSPGGRVAILSFHSGEDRRVKKYFQHHFREGIYSEVAPGPVRPTPEECFANRRARSAKLRWAVKSSD